MRWHVKASSSAPRNRRTTDTACQPAKPEEQAKAESTAGTLQVELTELRVESRQAQERVTAWVERVTRAEARLEELAKGAGGQGDRS